MKERGLSDDGQIYILYIYIYTYTQEKERVRKREDIYGTPTSPKVVFL